MVYVICYILLFSRGCLVAMFSLRFSLSKFLINSRRQFRVRKFFHDGNFVHFGSFCRIYRLFILRLKLLKIYA